MSADVLTSCRGERDRRRQNWLVRSYVVSSSPRIRMLPPRPSVVQEYGRFVLSGYCPTGLLIAISVLAPHGRAIVLPVLLSITYQVPFDGRHTAISVLPSPS
jgi:hypothetical protein